MSNDTGAERVSIGSVPDLVEWSSDDPRLPQEGQRLRVRLHDGRDVEYRVGKVRRNDRESTVTLDLEPLEPVSPLYRLAPLDEDDEA